MNTLRNRRGFTLIELMIVISIIALLAMVAIPAYQNYAIRARVTEGMGLASAAKFAVADVTQSNNTLPTTQTETGYVTPAATENVSSITIADQGVITIRFTSAAGGGTIVLTPSLSTTGDLTWNCLGGTLIENYRPASCRP